MRILHLANHNSTNIGNGALIFGTERLLREDAPFPIEFIAEPWDDYTFKRKQFDDSFVAHVNKSSDALLVNGAVTFNAFRKSMVHTGMRFNLPLELWDKIQVPIIFYGVSYRCWPFQQYPNKEALKRTIEYALKRETIFFGVRNDGTKEWIERELGIVSQRIYEVPDPGMFVTHEDHSYPELSATRKNIFIAFNGEDALYRFATPLQRMVWGPLEPIVGDRVLKKLFKITGGYLRRRREVAGAIARVVERLVREHDARFVLVPHYLDDYDMIDDFINEVQERIAHQLVVSTGLLDVQQTPYFYGRYKKADLVLAMRVHSMSPSIGLSVPVIPVTSQGRMRIFLKKAGLEDIACDITDDRFVDNCVERSNELLRDPQSFKDQLQRAVGVMREEARSINALVFECLGSNS